MVRRWQVLCCAVQQGGQVAAYVCEHRACLHESGLPFDQVMDYFRDVTGGDAIGGKFPGSAVVGLCSRERFKQLLKGLWRTHFTDGQVEALARRYPPSGDSFPVKVKMNDIETCAGQPTFWRSFRLRNNDNPACLGQYNGANRLAPRRIEWGAQSGRSGVFSEGV